MGLFSGSFGTGLITGLATSVDKSLRTAMDKRDEELSSARKFWQTRQAQKMDLAEARDTRVKKSLNRLIDEMGGDIASGLAAYRAAGGDPDSVEGFIKDLDDTRAAGLEYNLRDKLKLDGVDLSQFKDLTREQAFASERTEVPGLDIQMEDTSGLSNFGLAMKDMGKGISEGINKLIPPREREAIEGIAGGVLDRSGMITSERYKNEVIAAVPNMKTQLSANLYQINNGKDLMGKDLTEDAITNLELQNAKLLSQIGGIAKAEAAATDTGPTLSEISSLYTKGLTDLKTDIGYEVSSNGVMTVNTPEGVLEGQDAQTYWLNKKNEWKSNFVKNTIFDSSGSYVSNDADFAARSLGLGKVATSVRESLVTEPTDEDMAEAPTAPKAPEPPSQEEIKQQTLAKYPTANSFADNFKTKAPDAESLYRMLVQYYPDIDDAQLSQIAIDAIASKPKPRGFVSNGSSPKEKVPPLSNFTKDSKAYNEWLATYGQTHNPDGTPK